MPNPPQSAQSFLEDRKAAVLAELRREVPDLINEYLKLDAAISAMKETADGIAGSVGDEYYGFRRPIDAIEAYLDHIGRPATRKEIATSLANGGFARGQVQRPYWNVMSGLEYHVKNNRLKEVGGLVGKSEWPAKMFKEAKEG
jgi:hypothetical protein